MAALNIIDPKGIKAALAETLTTGQNRGWVLIGYTPGSKTDLVLQATKVGGTTAELVNALSDDQCQYAVIRIPDKKDKTDTVRDIMIAWSGPNVGIMEKSKKKTHIGEVKNLLSPFHADLEAISKANFTEEIVKDRSAPLSGSHVID